jgi:hypothetical protein
MQAIAQQLTEATSFEKVLKSFAQVSHFITVSD